MIKVHFFAILREQAGRDHWQGPLLEKANPKSLYDSLAREFGFSLTSKDLQVAVNDEFVDWNFSLQEGDEVVFIPPVAGG